MQELVEVSSISRQTANQFPGKLTSACFFSSAPFQMASTKKKKHIMGKE